MVRVAVGEPEIPAERPCSLADWDMTRGFVEDREDSEEGRGQEAEEQHLGSAVRSIVAMEGGDDSWTKDDRFSTFREHDAV